jgi:hypothetical protein
MTTDAQIAANRANALRSTGPNTIEGKVKSSQNARKRRRPGELPLTLVEDETAFAAHSDAVRAAFEPQNAFETELVLQIALHQWRLARVQRIEAALFDAETHRVTYSRHAHFSPSTLPLSATARPADIWPERIEEVSRREAALGRALDRALSMLARHRATQAQTRAEKNSESDPNFPKEIIAKP